MKEHNSINRKLDGSGFVLKDVNEATIVDASSMEEFFDGIVGLEKSVYFVRSQEGSLFPESCPEEFTPKEYEEFWEIYRKRL